MKKLTFFTLILLLTHALNAQVAINNDGSSPDPSAMLDIKSGTKGLLVPRLTTSNRNALSALAKGGLIVYDSDQNKFFLFNDSVWQDVSTGNLWTRNGSVTYISNISDFVGIGTTSPLKNLHIVGADTLASLLIAPNVSSVLSNESSEILLAENKIYSSGMSIRYEGSDDKLYFFGKNGSATYGPLLTVKRNGGVGINTSNPQKELHIMGSDTLVSLLLTPDKSNGANSEIIFAEDKNNYYGMSIRYDGNGNRMYFYGKNTSTIYGPNLTIKRDGNVGIGTGNPSELFQVVATGDKAAAYFQGEGTGGSDAVIHAVNTSSGTGNAGYFKSNGTGTALIIEHAGSGSLLKGYGENGGNEEINIANDGSISIFNSNHNKTIYIQPSESGSTDAGQITLYSADGGTATIEIDGSYGGKGRITTNELQITGGSDLSEFFPLSDNNNIEKGMVVSIDENHPGYLKICNESYDKKVAGIISGANNIEPGLIMSQKGSIADGEHLIALSGRVYCKAEAFSNPIEIGDMLTSSTLPGYAMKAVDGKRSKGAIIGKAMTPLKSGKGVVLVLVTLQ